MASKVELIKDVIAPPGLINLDADAVYENTSFNSGGSKCRDSMNKRVSTSREALMLNLMRTLMSETKTAWKIDELVKHLNHPRKPI